MPGSEYRGRAGLLPVCVIVLAVAGCGGGSTSLQTFELIAPQEFGEVRQARGNLSIAVPTALQVFDSERVVVRPSPGEVSYLSGARWSDRLPRLVQSRIVQAFENSQRLRSVVRVGDQLRSDYQLATELREFGVQIASAPVAVVEISARIVHERTGRVVASQVFTAHAEASSVDGPTATAAINAAFGAVIIDLVRWTSARI